MFATFSPPPIIFRACIFSTCPKGLTPAIWGNVLASLITFVLYHLRIFDARVKRKVRKEKGAGTGPDML
jgi:hypothetical protein